MAKNNLIIIGAVIIIALILFSSDKKEAGETLSRSLPTTVTRDSSFTLSYVVSNPAPPYFFSIVDTISGGCTVFGSPDIVTTLTSPTTTLPLTVQAPSSDTTCTFTGDWQLGDNPTVDFTTQSVIVCNPVDGGWTNWGTCTSCSQSRTCTNPAPSCGGANCVGSPTQSCGDVDGGWTAWSAWSDPVNECGTRTRTCTNPAPECSGASCVGDSQETLACECSIYGDTFPACDGITRSELGVVAQEWIVGQTSDLRTKLGLAAQNWIDNGGPA